ncbi:MAG TPA: hypothetical protein DCF84_06085 [Bacteroidetes bacterium]|nr:hypothetical protein [Bacteroidota bacterium]|tara:strand:+ start:2316 stop:2885 length:570 start_codon:yes stop_codon:yes gene_type:complete
MKPILSSQDLEQCLNQGDIVLYPTDTVWGLGCLVNNKNQVTKIYAIKERSRDQGIILLCSHYKQLGIELGKTMQQAIEIFRNERPTTFVIENTNPMLRPTESQDGTIAFRIVKDSSYLKSILSKLNGPLLSTSANLKGKQPAQRRNELDLNLIEHVDGIVEFTDTKGQAKPSRIMRYDTSKTSWSVLRD